jgi:O-antigen ligase
VAARSLPWGIKRPADLVAEAIFWPLHALIAAPSILFIVAIGLMLFHPPDFHFVFDRLALALLIFAMFLRVCALRQPVHLYLPVTLPLFALMVLAFVGAAVQPNEAETWSLFAAKWFVPFVLFHLAAIVFEDPRSLRNFELFSLVALGYLCFIAICFMVGRTELVFPRYILDEGLGYHADRARGPFLQAVANGVTLNLLGVIAFDSYRRRRLRGWLAAVVLIALPMAVVATKTRAVWLSFAGTILVLMIFSHSARVRRSCAAITTVGLVVLAVVLFFSSEHASSLEERFGERSPVDFRMAVYEAGGDMFLKKPWLGWDSAGMQAELARRVSGFHQKDFYFHNTYLEVLVRYGLLGLALYLWLMVGLFRIGRKRACLRLPCEHGFLDAEFRSLWPLFLGIYFVNGALVVMNYQFVNGLVFTIAGMLLGQNRRQAELWSAPPGR